MFSAISWTYSIVFRYCFWLQTVKGAAEQSKYVCGSFLFVQHYFYYLLSVLSSRLLSHYYYKQYFYFRFLCADIDRDMLKLMAFIIEAKVSGCHALLASKLLFTLSSVFFFFYCICFQSFLLSPPFLALPPSLPHSLTHSLIISLSLSLSFLLSSLFLCSFSLLPPFPSSLQLPQYPDKLQTPLLPTRPPPPELATRRVSYLKLQYTHLLSLSLPL